MFGPCKNCDTRPATGSYYGGTSGLCHVCLDLSYGRNPDSHEEKLSSGTTLSLLRSLNNKGLMRIHKKTESEMAIKKFLKEEY